MTVATMEQYKVRLTHSTKSWERNLEEAAKQQLHPVGLTSYSDDSTKLKVIK